MSGASLAALLVPEGCEMDACQLLSEIARRNVAPSPDDTKLSDLDNWDSLKDVRLVIRIEEIIHRQLSENEIEQLHSIGDVRKLLQLGG